MKIVCLTRLKTGDGTKAICGAVQMTGFKPGKHTLRDDLPCRGCGQVGNYDGVGDDWTAKVHDQMTAVNGDTKPVREL